MYENVVFALLAIGFGFMASRPKKQIIPLLSLAYRLAFMSCFFLAIYESYSFSTSVTSFTYAGSVLTSANTNYTYSNTLTSNNLSSDVMYIIYGLMFVSMVLIEPFEDMANETLRIASRAAGYGKGSSNKADKI